MEEVSRATPLSAFVKIGLVLTLVTLVLGSVRFARFDWTGLPLDRGPITAERQVGPCLEKIHPYTTESGRVIKPVVVDEMQYLSLVEHFRGVPKADLQSTCLYDPFTNRAGMSWIAHWIPGDEGVSLALVNTVMLVLGLWIVLTTIRSQGVGSRGLLAAGVLYSVAWNPFFFGTGVLVDPGVIAAIALCWFLISTKRTWLVWPIMLIGYPLKETIGIVIPVVWAASWQEYRKGDKSLVAAAGPALAATVAFVVGVAFWRQALPQPAASWEVTPDIDDIVHNLTDIISLASFAVGVLPLLIPAFLLARKAARADGWLTAILDPATVGVIMALGICGWSFITVDLTPRLFWIGFPFAATQAALWFSQGRAKEWLDGLALPRSLEPDSITTS
ncbi:MAG: hypothetical protein WBA45_11800 [Microthrixaceae bacterium]